MSYLLKKNKFILISLKISIFVIFSLLFLYGLYSYEENKIIYIFFSVINFYLIYFAFRKKSIFFETFFSILLFLGFWFKFTFMIILETSFFHEKIYSFDQLLISFDYALIVSIIGIAPFILFGHIRENFFYYPKKIKVPDLNDKFDKKSRFLLILLFISIVLVVNLLNAYFQIYQKGLASNLEINFFISGIVKWLLLFGFLSLSSFLIFFELIKFKKIFKLTFFITILETFLSSMSMLSRGMIFNSMALIYGIYKFNKKTFRNINLKTFLGILILCIVLFYISLISVNFLRSNYFFVGKSFIDDSSSVSLKEDKHNNIKKENNFLNLNNEILYLILNRWVGIDAVLILSKNKNILGKDTFINAFYEKHPNSQKTYYENTFNLNHSEVIKIKENVRGNTLTGVIAFFYYPGSYIFLFFSIFTLSAFASIIEIFSFNISNKNLIFASIIGFTLAYRFIHFGYLPSQTYLLLSTIFFTILLSYFLRKILIIKN